MLVSMCRCDVWRWVEDLGCSSGNPHSDECPELLVLSLPVFEETICIHLGRGREQGRRGQGKEGMEGERKIREVDKGKEVEEE